MEEKSRGERKGEEEDEDEDEVDAKDEDSVSASESKRVGEREVREEETAVEEGVVWRRL